MQNCHMARLEYNVWNRVSGIMFVGGIARSHPFCVVMQICRAVLSLAQKNISFGKLFTNEHRAKTLVLNNVSDVPLPYKIKKTGIVLRLALG